MPLRSDGKKAPAFFSLTLWKQTKVKKKGSFRTGVGVLDWTAFR
jgi:hypothetical protein